MTGKTANGATVAATELETFLPRDGTVVDNKSSPTKYVLTKNEDAEAAGASDLFKARNLEHPVTNRDTLTHLLKASLGTGILSMPAAFKASGLAFGIFTTIAVSIICTHCAYILVVCAHELYKRTGKHAMSFPEVAEESCLHGPKWAKRFSTIARIVVLTGLFSAYFTTCSCYTVLIAENFNYVLNHYLESKTDVRVIIAVMLVPLILLAYVPNLKSLAPVSMVANIFMSVGLCITFYYLVQEIKPFTERELIVSDIAQLPTSISIVIFAIEAIGVVMPLENHMETPRSFVGICGVLNQGMSGVTLMYIVLGFFGYLRYGEETSGSITHNLPKDQYAAQAVNILIGLAVFCTYGLQFYVCLEITWNGIKDKVQKKATLANYILRTVLVILSVVLAVAVPKIKPFVALIGAFCFSILGLICPILIEILTFWDKGFGKYNWKIFKNIIVIIVGLIALIFGSKSAIQDIIADYM